MKNSMFSQSSKIALVAAFSLVMMLASWRSFEAQRGRRDIALSTFLASVRHEDDQAGVAPLAPAVRELVAALRREVARVERNTGVSADGFDVERWRAENPCASRSELPRYYGRLSASPSRKEVAAGSAWEAVMAEYARLHRVCVRAAGNLTEYFYARSGATGCRFFIAEAKNGLGNKLFIMAPSVLYAVLTQRVILIPESTGVPNLMCEPFPGSSWRLSADLQNGDVPIWNQTEEFLRNVDRAKREHQTMLPIYASRIDDHWLPVSRFFCDVEQSYFRQVPWLSVHGCLYFLPKLFAIPSHQVALEALFPDPTVALTHILRSAFLPRDDVWARVADAEHLLNSSHSQVGIQARYFNSSAAKHKVINANVEACLVENSLLDQTPGRETTIFIASLTPDLRERLQAFVSRNQESRASRIAFQQLTSEQEQRLGMAVYEQVLVEVLHLSLSHTLLVSPASTFGGLAQAYGALTPWFIEARDDVTTPCLRGQTSDGCFQSPDHAYRCPYEAGRVGKSFFDFIRYLKPCLEIDARGMQLVDGSKNRSVGELR